MVFEEKRAGQHFRVKKYSQDETLCKEKQDDNFFKIKSQDKSNKKERQDRIEWGKKDRPEIITLKNQDKTFYPSPSPLSS